MACIVIVGSSLDIASLSRLEPLLEPGFDLHDGCTAPLSCCPYRAWKPTAHGRTYIVLQDCSLESDEDETETTMSMPSLDDLDVFSNWLEQHDFPRPAIHLVRQ